MSSTHPVALAIDYPDRPLNRLSTAFRPFAALLFLGPLLPRPDVAAGDVSRGLPLVTWLLAIPHYIVPAVLWIGVGRLGP